MRASSGCLTLDAYPVKGPTLVAKNVTRMGHPPGYRPQKRLGTRAPGKPRV